MLVTIDRTGRLVVPNKVRDRINLEPDSEFEISVEGNSIRLDPVRRPARLVVEHDGLPVLAPVAGMTTTDADVQRWGDADQR